MRQNKLSDPLGNTVVVPAIILNSEDGRCYNDIKIVITDPAFVIEIKKEELYFFRLIDFGINILVEAKMKNSVFSVEACIENPTTEYIADLLKKGILFAYSSAFKQTIRYSKRNNGG
jgi:hypothetical protein